MEKKSQKKGIKVENTRKSYYPVDEIFINRRSSRAFSQEPLAAKELMSLFEAARWAPSSYNDQPWRFVYAQQGMPEFQQFFDLLDPFNQSWANKANVLVVAVAKTTFDLNGKPNVSASYDVGAACQSLLLQAYLNKINSMIIGGFDSMKAVQMLNLSSEYKPEVMIALGKPGTIADVSEKFQSKEGYSSRKSLEQIVFKGSFKP